MKKAILGIIIDYSIIIIFIALIVVGLLSL